MSEQEQMKAVAESLNRLAIAIEQNNQLIVQVLQVNSALLESVFDEQDDGDIERPDIYLDGSPVDKDSYGN